MKYKKAYGEEMLRYFESDGEDLPSFVRFASQKGVDMEELRRWKRISPSFAAKWQMCEEILCDRIVHGAMHKHFDVSFSKFLLTARYGWAEKGTEEADEDFSLRIRVLDGGGDEPWK